MKKSFILFLVLFSLNLYSQEVNIINELKAIENGEIELAKTSLAKLKASNPENSSIIFLEAVLTEDGEKSIDLYQTVLDKFPTSKYADASLYRIYSYYYALGIYRRANIYLNQLKSEYPNSPYLKSNSISQFTQEYESANVTRTNNTSSSTKNNTENNSNTNEKKEMYSIQVAAFLNQTNAINLSNQLKSKQYESFITDKEVGGSILKVVFVGNYDSEDKAKKVLEDIKKEFGLSPKLIKN